MTPRNVSEVLQLLQTYHQRRRDRYRRLVKTGGDAHAEILLEHLVDIEEDALQRHRAELRGWLCWKTRYLPFDEP